MKDWLKARLIYITVEVIEIIYKIPNLWRK